jgi:hypothetical protein
MGEDIPIINAYLNLQEYTIVHTLASPMQQLACNHNSK